MADIRTSQRSKMAPAAADTVGFSYSGGVPWTSSAFVELLAATADDAQLLTVHLGALNAVQDAEIDIAYGGAGSEHVFCTVRVNPHTSSPLGDNYDVILPAPLNRIPDGERISARARGSHTSTSGTVAVTYLEGSDNTNASDSILSTIPAAANNVSVTPSGTAWNNSSYVELSSGLSDTSYLAGLAYHLGTDAQWEFEFATGGAGSEAPVTVIRGEDLTTTGLGFAMLERAYGPVAATTRISVRMRKSGTSTTAFTFAAMYYGPDVVQPTVETLSASAIRSTSANLRGRIDPNGIGFFGRFRWWVCAESPPNYTETTPVSVGDGSNPVVYTTAITGLLPDTTYCFQAIGNDGTSPADDLFGTIHSFTTTGEAIFIDGTVSHPLTWQELTDREENLTVFAEVDLNDPESYYGGYKKPSVLEWKRIVRQCSDRAGQIAHMIFGARHSDTDRYWRGLLAGVTSRFLTNRPLVERMIDDEERRRLGLPRVVV